jgi:lysophospholipase L1-like esterase
MLRIRNGEKLLFIGDSITQCMRETVAPPLGAGFVQFVHCFLAARYPDVEVAILNRGIDGETIRDLEARWGRDVLAEAPDWLFVMIGVNDALYRNFPHTRRRAVPDEEYRATYRRLMQRTRERLACRVVLLDPTPLEEHLSAPSHEVMRGLCRIVRDVAQEFGTEHVPIFERFYRTVERAPRRGWLVDVPHPNLAGQAILALAVLEHLGW